MTSFIAAGGSGRSTSVIPAVPAASSVTTIAFIRHLPASRSRLLHRRQSSSHAELTARDETRSREYAACSLPHRGTCDSQAPTVQESSDISRLPCISGQGSVTSGEAISGGAELRSRLEA